VKDNNANIMDTDSGAAPANQFYFNPHEVVALRKRINSPGGVARCLTLATRLLHELFAPPGCPCGAEGGRPSC
jgi:hypothetical protein